jgi:hypothetical protein
MKHALFCLPALALLALAAADRPRGPRTDPEDLARTVARLQGELGYAAGPDLKAIEPILYDNLKGVINRGVALYNGGDIAGCYRLFEGSLRSIKPLVAHHPDLTKEIDNALAGAEKNPVLWQRAFALRTALDKVRAKFKPAGPGVTDKKDDGKKDDGKKPDDKKGGLKKDDDVLKEPRELKEGD